MQHTSGTSRGAYACHNLVNNSQASSAITAYSVGTVSISSSNSDGADVTTSEGAFCKSMTGASGGDIQWARGIRGEVELNTDKTINDAVAVAAIIDGNDGTINHSALFKGWYEEASGASIPDKIGILTSGSSKNRLDGHLGINTWVTGIMDGRPAIAIGDSDTGIYQETDGELFCVSNNTRITCTKKGRGFRLDRYSLALGHAGTQAGTDRTIEIATNDSFGGSNDNITGVRLFAYGANGWGTARLGLQIGDGWASYESTVRQIWYDGSAETRSHNWSGVQYSVNYDYGDRSGNLTIDFDLRNNYRIKATGDLTLDNPTGGKNGQSGSIMIWMQGHTLSFGSAWKKDVDSPSPLYGNSATLISYYYYTSSNVIFTVTRW